MPYSSLIHPLPAGMKTQIARIRASKIPAAKLREVEGRVAASFRRSIDNIPSTLTTSKNGVQRWGPLLGKPKHRLERWRVLEKQGATLDSDIINFLEEGMRPGDFYLAEGMNRETAKQKSFSWSGFLSPDNSLLAVMARDKMVLDFLDLSANQMGSYLEKKDSEYDGARVASGWQECPFMDGFEWSGELPIVYRVKGLLVQWVNFVALMKEIGNFNLFKPAEEEHPYVASGLPHLMQHGLFEGNVPSRVSPEEIVECFGLEEIQAFEPEALTG